jgi:subtilisin family serine protease
MAGRRRPALIAMAVIAASATAIAVTTTGNAQAQQDNGTKLYLVQTDGSPVASYDGGVTGLAATRPTAGAKLDANTPAAKAYRGHLTEEHNSALSRARISTTSRTADYGVTFNGFAARLTSTEANRLTHTKGVTRVWENEIITVDTVSTPNFLGLTGKDGVWNSEFDGVQHAGEGVIVGVIDTGLWPEGGSFAPLSEPRPDASRIAAKWHGVCDAGAPSAVTPGGVFTCNNKVIGGRFYNATGLAQPYEFLSPRDYNGHGSHTSSTAAGDNNVPATINGGAVGNVSGMAPAARIAVYKALWHNQATGSASGGTADLVAAIDDAVADGVDVINYSISGSRQYVVDPAEIAFFNAAAAGVFVSASAGNEGPGASTVAHNSPWVTTVAASTHDRSVAKTVTLGNGAVYNGVGVGGGVGPAALVDAATAALPGVSAAAAARCFSDVDLNPGNGITPVLDPAKIAGKIVLCQRGTNARVDKSLAVANAGGIGMILFNPTPNSLNADYHSVPSIHVDNVSGAAIKAYVATPGATATISAVLPIKVRAPQVAGFSSAGPALAGDGNLLKPDIAAPGVDVIAAVAPPGNNGNLFDALSGTSMSAPHIAGIAALIASAHPNWSPMWIKSALMTSATTKDNTGAQIQRDTGAPGTPFDYGSGQVVPGKAFEPGLVYDSGPLDWLKYGCGIGQFQLITSPSFCASVGSIDPSDLNYPSVAIGHLAGTQTVTRTVTNIGGKAGTYTASVSAPAGFAVTVSPSTITVPGHGKATFTVTITRTTAALGTWAFGSFTWRQAGNDDHVVRSPIAVNPVPMAAAGEVTYTGTSGSASVATKIGYTGTLNTTVTGLVPATVGSLALDPNGPSFSGSNPVVTSRSAMVTVTIPAGTKLARFATFAADYPANTDVDIYIYQVNGSSLVPVDQSAGGTADEAVTLTDPAPGTYAFFADLFASPSGPLTVKPYSWVLDGTAAGNLTAGTPSQAVTSGTTINNGLSWSGLTAGLRYLGVAYYSDGTSTVGSTVVNVNS